MKTTSWYAAQVKPVRAGLYQVWQYSDVCWCWWDGEYWGLATFNKVDAVKSSYGKHRYALQDKVWRGMKPSRRK